MTLLLLACHTPDPVGKTPTDATTGESTVPNTGPTAPLLHIEPVAPFGGDTLTAVVDRPAADPDGDALAETLTWSVDGEAQADWLGSTTVDGAAVRAGQTWRVVLAAEDGTNPPVLGEASVTVGNRAPAIEALVLSPANPADADPLTAFLTAADPDGDALTTRYRWFRDGVEALDVGDVSVAPADATTGGETWYVEATVSDAWESSVAVSNTVTIAEAPFRRRVHHFTGTARADADGRWTDLTGEWTHTFQLVGDGTADCTVVWSVTGTAGRCRDCAWAFETEIVYEPDASVILTPDACVAFETDGTAYLTYDDVRYVFDMEAEGPTWPDYHGDYWRVSPYPIYWYSRPGYSRSEGEGALSVYWMNQDVDGAGNFLLDAYAYYYRAR